MARYQLTELDREVMEKAAGLETGGMPVFTAHFFSPIEGTPRWDLVWRDPDVITRGFLDPNWDDRIPPDEWDLDFEAGEYVPWVPLSWQAMIAHDQRMDATLIAGFGCLTLDARVYEADLQQYVSIAWLIRSSRAPTVLAKTPSGWAKVRATVPYFKKSGPLYRVKTESGHVIDASGDHAFLTTRGYVRTLDLLPGDKLIAPDRLPATVHSESEGGSRCLEKASGYPDCCWPRRRPCGVRLRCPSAGAQFSLPSPAGAPSPTHCSLCALCTLAGLALPHRQAACGSRRLPRLDSTYLLVRHAEPGVPRRWRAARHGPARPAQADQALLQSEGTTSPDWQDVLGSERVDLAPMASFFDESDHIVWSYRADGPGSTRMCAGLLATLQLLRVSHAHPQEPAISARSTSPMTYVSPCGTPPNSDFWYCTTTDTVAVVEEAGECDFYDLHVPIYNNYVAEGVVHHNSGKTVGIGAAFVYWCCMVPGFKAMNAAPVGWQAEQMYSAIKDELADYENRDERPTYLALMIKKMRMRPYPKIEFYNGSSIEFMSADENCQKILSWSGDVAAVDEAGKLEEVGHTSLDEVLVNLGSRMRGQTRGRTRLGKLIIMSTADYCPELWERFDAAEDLPNDYLSILLTTYDNPYNTERQIKAIEGRIQDKTKKDQLMLSKRPLPKGKEFPPELLKPCQSKELNGVMRDARQEEIGSFEYLEMPQAGVVRWVIPPNNYDRYIEVGDPGQSMPPARNSGCIGVIKVTGFPRVPAELHALWWGPHAGQDPGSYWPFINTFEAWNQAYHPIWAAFDASGIQKGFDELVFAQHGFLVEGLNLQYQKRRMVLALKLVMGKGLLLMPEEIAGIWMQLGNWRMPDTKLRQDVASMLFLAGDVLTRLFVIDEEDATDAGDTERLGSDVGRPQRVPNTRVTRQGAGRNR